ncbi:MAG: hypothetical protein QM784_20225 [Polyangiaceae bacterium]
MANSRARSFPSEKTALTDSVNMRVPNWSPEKSSQLYQISGWGSDYFSVNEAGHVVVRPDPRQDLSIDLFELVGDLTVRGHDLPVLIRFSEHRRRPYPKNQRVLPSRHR